MNKFSELLNKEAYDYKPPQKGEFRTGVLLEIDEYGAVVDIGQKYDGIVPRGDIERLDEETLKELTPGQEVTAQVIRPVDREGRLTLSLAQVQAQQDWKKAQQMFDHDEIWYGKVSGYNRGGLLARFGQLQAFIPASQLEQWHHKSSSQSRKQKFKEYIGQELPLKLIEIDEVENRLIASERVAQRELRQQRLEQLLEELSEGQVVKGTVRNLTNFGAFIDLGGADGMVHISELSWQNVDHPREVVSVGDEIEVQVLELDRDRQRISLSLKEMQPNPWSVAHLLFAEDQLVQGTVRNIVSFGAFVDLAEGISGLLHVSEIADPPPNNPKEFVQRGDVLVLRVLDVSPVQQRISLSLKRVSDEEREEWLAQQEQQ